MQFRTLYIDAVVAMHPVVADIIVISKFIHILLIWDVCIVEGVCLQMTNTVATTGYQGFCLSI